MTPPTGGGSCTLTFLECYCFYCIGPPPYNVLTPPILKFVVPALCPDPTPAPKNRQICGPYPTGMNYSLKQSLFSFAGFNPLVFKGSGNGQQTLIVYFLSSCLVYRLRTGIMP